MTSSIFEAVVIGASAGAVDALSDILPALPPSFPIPIIIVVHIPPQKPSIMADLFDAKCSLLVKEAEDKEPLVRGTIYFAPPDYHLLVEAAKTLALSNEEPVLFSRPSIDVLFESAADAYGPGLLAIVLTGANHDGSEGLRAVVDAGGAGLVQDPETAFSSTMPEAAIKACPGAQMLSLAAIADYLGKV
ncbi:chemotaxis protein CheB [Rhizobium sp. WYJ-E13]|uniref:chemotaxis protein CheB n=1 Tax=unclassified Rhizobium TaxID=2613769 RepID=UPI001C1EA864|nr:chemotaxis protein CheB [Rhizobium sp. WYJ-E13]QWW71155.1 chemotaxis protein CheB [Rhizobium sp. WYJ-E13]